MSHEITAQDTVAEAIELAGLDAAILAALAQCAFGLETNTVAEETRPAGPMTTKEREAHRGRVARRLRVLQDRGNVRQTGSGRPWRWHSIDARARAAFAAKQAAREAKAAHVLAVAREQGHALPLELDVDGDLVEPDYNDRNFSAFSVTLTADQYLALVEAATRSR